MAGVIPISLMRELRPECEGRSDQEIAKAYHKKFFPDMNYEEFLKKLYTAEAYYTRAKGGRRGSARTGAKSQGEGKAKSNGGYSQELVREMASQGYKYEKELDGFYPFEIIDGKPVIKDDAKLRASEDYISETEKKLAERKRRIAEGSYEPSDPLGLRGGGDGSPGKEAQPEYDLNPQIGRGGIGAYERSPVMDIVRELDRRAVEQYEMDYPQGLPEEYYHAPALGINGASGYYQAMRGQGPQSYEGSAPLYPERENSAFRWGRNETPAASAPSSPAIEYKAIDIGENNLPAEIINNSVNEMRHAAKDIKRGWNLLGEGISGAVRWIKGPQEPIEIEPDPIRDYARW